MALALLRNLKKAGRKRELTWQYLFNFGPTVSYRLNRPALSGEAAKVLHSMRRHGIAMTSVENLLANSDCYHELVETVDALETEQSAQLETARDSAENSEIGQKTFSVELLGRYPRLDPASVFARFALQKEVLEVANAYFGMYACLRYYNVWHTLTTQGKARESQLWHRDREDFHILKVFVYLSDVDAGAGPFTYATGSHNRSNVRREPEYVVEGGVKRTNDSQMEKVVPSAKWKTGAGSRGTIVFADTSGYHKGGLARDRERIMYTCIRITKAFRVSRRIQRPGRSATRLCPCRAK
jgi:hypothetical protein